ncbi:phytanoyl-CoA dioxygenase, peroxisomal isoform X2 [Fopius arisanus]|uniref:phytanoyl-CoA dioxygenase n=1 Tax=Fopius arisanus TaxID=64838 RepID=A0A9R1TMV3_9HYME|nr:PREDICTED: phytanoyl-CoA dioxygenase, peroxisomal-like isoform X2 [Fopius arisanus]
MGSHYFRLTRDTAKLTLKQRNFYETSGFLVLPKLIPQQLLDKFSQRFDDIVAGKVDRGVITVMKDVIHRSSVNKLQDINRDDIFRLYIENKEILDIVECFTGKNIMAIHSMLIAKPPDIGAMSSRISTTSPSVPRTKSSHPGQRSSHATPKTDVYSSHLEVISREKSILTPTPRIIPQIKCITASRLFYQNIPESTRWIDLEMEPGDTVFFHPLLIHGSGVNKSNCTRKAISCHYAAAECNYIEVAGTIQENIAKEVLEVTMRRLPGIEIRYEDVWKLKSSIARGFRSNL